MPGPGYAVWLRRRPRVSGGVGSVAESTDARQDADDNWEAVEQRLSVAGPDPSRPLRARLEYCDPIDVGDEVELLELARQGRLDIAFAVEGASRRLPRSSRPCTTPSRFGAVTERPVHIFFDARTSLYAGG
jgi:hypothetical protein